MNKSPIEEEFDLRKQHQKLLKKNCQKEIEDFVKCATGRTFSVTWKCRSENKTMKDCLTKA